MHSVGVAVNSEVVSSWAKFHIKTTVKYIRHHGKDFSILQVPKEINTYIYLDLVHSAFSINYGRN
jgi:hypothetical protein